MAEPLIYDHSPMAHYLIDQVPQERPISFPPNLPLSPNYDNNLDNPTPTSPSIPSFFHLIKAFLSNSSSLNHYQSLPNSPLHPILSPSSLPDAHPDPDPDPEKRLSERLKYIICSSCLLNPNLEPAFYDSHISSQPSSATLLDAASLNPPELTLSLPVQSSSLSYSSVLHSFRLFRPHPRITLALSALLILIGYHASLSWALFSMPFLAISFSPRLRSRFLLHDQHLPHPSPRSIRLKLHSDLVSTAAELVDKSQALDLRISRGFGAVKEVECVALGLGLSNPMPPISRLETASFPLAGSSYSPSPSPRSPLSNCASPSPTRPEITLHAMGLRKVLQRVLDQARHEYERASLELESVIDSPLLNPALTEPGAGPSPLATLMDMYGCSRESAPEPVVARRRSVSDRVRRQTWRASLHSRVSESPSGSPLSPQETRFSREQFSTPHTAKRASWQPIFSPTRCLSDSYSMMDDRKLLHLRTHSRPNSLYGTPLAHDPGFPSPRPGTPSLSPIQGSDFSRQRDSPRPRPASYYPGTRPPIQSAGPPGNRRASMLGSSAGRSKPRPASMMASSFRGLSSPSLYYHPGRSPELSPNAPPSPCSEQHCDAARVDDSEPAPPFSLRALQSTFERMDISRKRLLCCLLALDLGPATPAGAGILQETVESVREMIKVVEGLGAELMAGMSAEFGPGSFEGGATTVRGQAQDEAGGAEEQEQEVVRDFAPPVAPAEAKAQRMGQLMGQLEAMDLALRSISAKMQVCVEELGVRSEGGSGTARAVAVHDSIRADLETVAREWDASRSKLRCVVEGERTPRVGANRLRPTSLDSSEGGASTSGWSGVASSVVSSEVLTPVEEYGVVKAVGQEEEEGGEEEEQEEEEAVKAVSMAAPPGLEEMLERVGSVRTSKDRGSGKWGSGASGLRQLSREEQVELMEQRRQSLPIIVGRRQSTSGLVGGTMGGTSKNGMMMVTELKDVLNVLKSKRVEQVRHEQ